MTQFDSFAYSILTMVIFGGLVVIVLSFYDKYVSISSETRIKYQPLRSFMELG
jgi:hypothetical protein